MTQAQLLIVVILSATVALFLWGRWRHDMVAVGALLACVLGGLVAPVAAFSGFGHPAVITVACVLVLSRGLQTSGAVDVVTRRLLPGQAGPTLTIAALTVIGALLSGFMNNVGALALLMPVAVQIARRQDLPPGRVLMPLAFGSILGGMTTLIGTPPNLIVAAFRGQSGVPPFGMFDFTPVGLTVAGLGVALIVLVGWRLVPVRRQTGADSVDIGAYVTEARVPADSKAVGKRLREIERALDDADAQVIGLVRNNVRVTAPHAGRMLLAGDILVLEADAEALANALSSLGLQLEAARSEETEPDGDPTGKAQPRPDSAAPPNARQPQTRDDKQAKQATEKEAEKPERSDDVVLMEFAVLPASMLVGRSASGMLLRTRYGINLLAVSRQGRRSRARLRALRFKGGDLLLMQGAPEALAEFATNWNCVPLAERALHFPNRRRALVASIILAAAVAVAALGLLPAAVSFAAGVLASMAFRTVPPRAVYDAIDWPVIVLLAALIPVANAMESTGTAALIANFLLDSVARGHTLCALVLILIVTMTLSDLVNNAATAAVMCPIAVGTAGALGVNTEPFLMAVAVGASCAFLTPIGHQNNTLILGPGGFKFGDYWPLGLPLQILVIVVAVPTIMFVWPL
jgi:di/tricarboxylate transporter